MILIRLMTLLILAIALCHGDGSEEPWKPSTSSLSLRSGKSSTSSSSDEGTSCPDGSSTDEGEGCRTSVPDTSNGGCRSGGLFSNIIFGESICGTVSTFYSDSDNRFYSDTDWYKVKVSTDNTLVSVRLTTDFDAFLQLFRLGDVNPCGGLSKVARTNVDVGNNTYVISENVEAGDYTIIVGEFIPEVFSSSLFCPTPGN